MYSKSFTNRVNKILKIVAQDIAKQFNSDKLMPEHIILAILKENGVATRALKILGVNVSDIILEIENHLIKNEGPLYLGDISSSQEVERLIELSIEESKNMGYNFIGTEHFILACLLEPGTFLYQVFDSHGVNVNKYKDAIVKIIGFGKTSPKKDNIKKTPTLDEYGRDLTNLARKGKLDKVIGREKEIERVIQILSRRSKNNPILIGEPGVGKTAIVEGLAQKIVINDVPEQLIGKRVVVLDLAQVIAGTKYRGEFEERLKRIMKEITEVNNIILFIDELHTIIGAGAAEGAIDASNMLKPALSRGEIQCIGATTLNEYKKYVEKDAALERRFQAIFIEEPSVEDAINILKGIKSQYEAHHNIIYTDKAIEMACQLSHRYISGRYLPDKAIDLIDEAGAKVKIRNSIKPSEIINIEQEIELLNNKKIYYTKELMFEECEIIKNQLEILYEKKDNFFKNWQKGNNKDKYYVTENDILELISNITKIPLSKIAEDESVKLIKMEEELQKYIIGQEYAIKVISSAIRRSRVGISSKKRPIGSFMFLGPTGVGKTELAKVLAEFLFGNKDSLIRIDMSEFMEKHNVSRLIGAPPGYIGYEEGGILTEKIRRKPYSLILFDEIEKAHPDVYNILLQILEEGELSDNLGHTVSFKNCIIIITSNIGAKYINVDNSFGFSPDNYESNYKNIKSLVLNELRKEFNPEFINRLDEVVIFNPLTKDNLYKILDIMFAEIQENIKENNISIVLSEEVKDYLINKNYDKKYGARTLRRSLQKEISDPLSLEILNKSIKSGDSIIVDIIDDKIIFNKINENNDNQFDNQVIEEIENNEKKSKKKKKILV